MLILVSQNNVSPYEPWKSPPVICLLLILHSESEHLVRSVFDSLIAVDCLYIHVRLSSDEPMKKEVGYFTTYGHDTTVCIFSPGRGPHISTPSFVKAEKT